MSYAAVLNHVAGHTKTPPEVAVEATGAGGGAHGGGGGGGARGGGGVW